MLGHERNEAMYHCRNREVEVEDDAPRGEGKPSEYASGRARGSEVEK
jgi:hypothetical protein